MKITRKRKIVRGVPTPEITVNGLGLLLLNIGGLALKVDVFVLQDSSTSVSIESAGKQDWHFEKSDAFLVLARKK